MNVIQGEAPLAFLNAVVTGISVLLLIGN